MKVCIIANREESDIGLLFSGLDIGTRNISVLERREHRNWKIQDSADLFLHLGSSWSVYWDSVRPHVNAEISVMEEAVSRGVPVLGICFGAQLMAQAFGGSVTRNKKAEIGWHSVESVDHASVLRGRWMQWHYDCLGTPQGFEELASNEAGTQAIRRSRSLGVQFHPEATEEIVSRWIAGDGAAELAALDLSPSVLLDETRREVMRTSGATAELMHWFLENIADSPFEAR